MEIIVGTFFIIYLVVFIAREWIKSLGEDGGAVVIGVFDALSVLALWFAIDYVLETNDKDILALVWMFFIIPIGFGAIIWGLYMCCSSYHKPYEYHREMGLRVLSNKSIPNNDIDFNWLSKEQHPERWKWLDK